MISQKEFDSIEIGDIVNLSNGMKVQIIQIQRYIPFGVIINDRGGFSPDKKEIEYMVKFGFNSCKRWLIYIEDVFSIEKKTKLIISEVKIISNLFETHVRDEKNKTEQRISFVSEPAIKARCFNFLLNKASTGLFINAINNTVFHSELSLTNGIITESFLLEKGF